MRIASFLSSMLLVLLTTACGGPDMLYVSTSFHEPATDGLRFIYSADGMHWDSIPGTWLSPEVGQQKVMRDPSIQQTPDGTFHLVWTSSWRGDRGFGYSSSTDLINWTPERFIEVMPDTSTVNVWAPELFWDSNRKEMMVVWASCVPTKNFALGIEEEKNNHRLYYTTTKDFQTFSPSQLLIDPGYSSIDATLVERRIDDFVMVVKDNTRPNRNIKISFAKDPHGPWGPTSAPFTPEFCEGPTTLALADGTYLIYCDRYRIGDFGCYSTRDFIHFEDITAKTSVPKGHKHGTVFRAKKKLIKAMLKTRGIDMK